MIALSAEWKIAFGKQKEVHRDRKLYVFGVTNIRQCWSTKLTSISCLYFWEADD